MSRDYDMDDLRWLEENRYRFKFETRTGKQEFSKGQRCDGKTPGLWENLTIDEETDTGHVRKTKRARLICLIMDQYGHVVIDSDADDQNSELPPETQEEAFRRAMQYVNKENRIRTPQESDEYIRELEEKLAKLQIEPAKGKSKAATAAS